MNTKKFSPKNIGTLILNDFKRFWIMAVAEFAVIFMSSSSILLMDKNTDEFTIQGFLTANGVGNGFIVMFWPLIMAALVFGYLHYVNRVTAMHSLPVTRKEHFVAHTISGYLLTTLPIMVNGIILAILSRPTMIDGRNIFTVGAVVRVVLLMMLVALVTYSFCVLAGMICGTGVMHILGSIAFIILVPSVLMVVDSNFDLLLKGYCTPDWLEDAMYSFLPIINITKAKAGEIIWYIAIALIALALALIAYEKRPLENATDPLVFKFTEPLAVAYLTFIFASSMGEYFIALDNSYIMGVVWGVAIGYIIFTMICQKTTRILNARNMRNAAIFVVAMALFIGGCILDLTGFAKKVPETSNIKSAEITSLYTPSMTENVESRINWAYNYTTPKFEDAATINKIRELHQAFIKSNMDEKSDMTEDEEMYLEMGIKYTTKSGAKIRRMYDISLDEAEKMGVLQELYESPEFKDKYKVLNYKSSKNVEIKKVKYSWFDEEREQEIEENIEDVNGLFEAMDKDFENRSLKEEFEAKDLGYIDIYTNKNGPDEYTIWLYKSDTNTLNFLRENGII